MNQPTNTSKFSIIFPVVCTLIGVFATSTFTWLTSYQTASLSQRSACIQRIDIQEKNYFVKKRREFFSQRWVIYSTIRFFAKKRLLSKSLRKMQAR